MNIKPLPSKKTTISIDRSFSSKEMKLIRKGLRPEQMEDKWIICWENNTLSFYRSWTGVCIYVVRFTSEDDTTKMFEADVNRDPKQYKETDDETDKNMISYLIDVLLLNNDAIFPSEESSSEKQAIEKWHHIGRASLGQHPDNK